MKIEGPYDAKQVEDKIYKLWENSGFFNPDNLPKRHKKPFSMVLPPPNVTGTLHIGHALTVTIEDIIVRYQRMLGKKTLWIPGTDHASIATETKFLKETGIRKSDYNDKRDEFVNLVNKFALNNQSIIINQLRAMGASLDWPDKDDKHNRLAFTMDDKRKWAVYKAFEQMYNEELIYRGLYLVNWDPKGRTGVSDEEMIYELEAEHLYTFKYNKDFPFKISTYRPETKLADIAVAVHPNDDRYKEYIGKEYSGLFPESLKIKIIADESVDKEFGTGAVGLTPAHSKIDKEIAERHNLLPKRIDEIQLISEEDTILLKEFIPKEYRGEKKLEARKKLIEHLDKEALLEKPVPIVPHEVPKAQRTNGRIETLPHNDQCFINVNKKIPRYKNKTLQDLMLEPISKGKIKIIPEHFEKIYINWIKNLHDWNISRQVWYGHRVPFWYCNNKKNESCCVGGGENPIISFEKPKECPRCKGVDTYQDSDTLDTWFSSGLWTFSTLGWPNKTKDLKTYHPTDVLETGYDIIFFWVARMILMSTFLLGEVPFHTVYLHGLVRDQQRKKMSKSLGNVIDPLVMTEKYGTDALRFALIFGTAPGTDSVISEDKIKGMKNFANKIWNASRFVLMNMGGYKPTKKISLSATQNKNLKNLQKLTKETTKLMDEYKFYIAGGKIYHYFWHTFCDKIIEESKAELANEKTCQATQYMLLEILSESLKLLHPFMPFITEEIYQQLPIKNKKQCLMIENWPK